MNKLNFISLWEVKKNKKPYFMATENKPVYKNGDFIIYHQTKNCFLIVYKNALCVSQLAAINKNLVDGLVLGQPAEGMEFLHERVIEKITKAEKMIYSSVGKDYKLTNEEGIKKIMYYGTKGSTLSPIPILPNDIYRKKLLVACELKEV